MARLCVKIWPRKSRKVQMCQCMSLSSCWVNTAVLMILKLWRMECRQWSVFLQIILYVRTRHRRYYLCFVRKVVIQLSIWLRFDWILRRTASLQSSPILDLQMFQLQMSIQKSLIDCCVVVFGVSYSWIMKWREMLTLASLILMDLNWNPSRRNRRIFPQSASESWHQFRCHTLTLRN